MSEHRPPSFDDIVDPGDPERERLLSAHELRSEEARSALFAELRRVLGPAGRIVVA